jgi:hypothetical protein
MNNGDNGDRLSALDRAIQTALGDDRPLGTPDDPARRKLPNLWAWLSQTRAGGDYVKQPAILTVRLGPQGVLATLTDRDLAVSLDVSSETLAGVFLAVETALQAVAPPLRSWGRKEPQLRRRRPKA